MHENEISLHGNESSMLEVVYSQVIHEDFWGEKIILGANLHFHIWKISLFPYMKKFTFSSMKMDISCMEFSCHDSFMHDTFHT